MNVKAKSYNSLSDMFLLLNRDIILHPEEYVSDVPGAAAYIRPLLLSSSSTEFNMNISEMSYGSNKFNRLRNTYISQEAFIEFKEKIKKQKGCSCTFYFNQVKKKQGTTSDNGPCLVAMIFTRPNKKSEWDTVDVIYRSTQLNRIFCVDLLLISKFIDEVPGGAGIKKVRFYIPQPWQSIIILPGYFKTFGVDETDINSDHWYHRKLRNDIKRLYRDPKNVSSYKSVKRAQLNYFGVGEWKPLDQDKYHIQNPSFTNT